ncbi:DNA polymerase/3'-5' exonuclease PolX [Ornithinibacillus halotolerans]|uniref:DNA-directed DNA polymerase n=1 Tax=Ornithinibacillus halotolerans TaxID=1274357 RepID=A0A916S760_9BACI|nr:DNA polymerase/3'-5' exonuclease PolX [Ornithinibacillus halotolerans]GGA86251.1 DNA polymerase/3'-5' exonuclease PolX [Ornithinibacillus halotolerans]
MEINKKDVIKLLETIAVYLELKGENPFKISAFRKAAQALERDERSLSDIKDFTQIKGIGKGTNTVILEYLQEGKSNTLEELKEEIPSGLLPLLNVPGLGGKKLAKLYQELQVIDATSLKDAIESGKVETLAGFGKKSAEKILAALNEFGKRPERLPIAYMLPIAEQIEIYLETISEVQQFSRAGSLRRMRETIKDLDFIIATENPTEVREQLFMIPNLKEVIAKGDTKISVTLDDVYDVNVDFRLVTSKEFATTLHHFTGSKDHNVMMRQLAKSRGEKINEYGIEVDETKEVITFSSEKDFFNHFGLQFIPPEVREGTGEVEAFNNNVELVELKDVRGDLHMHTTWSDGAQTLEEMVNQARSYGYDYIAITDHSKNLRVANGLDEDRLRQQREEIYKLNEKYSDIHIFAGVEMDILPDGSLDFSDEFLKELDYCIAAIHSSFSQTEEQIMKRLYTALDNPYVSLIAHPTGRLIGRRDGYKVNMEKLIERARETNTALEINANPNRLDISAEWARACLEAGVKIAVNTDAHNYKMLEHMKYGISVARKGWLPKETILNTWTKEKLIEYFNRNK